MRLTQSLFDPPFGEWEPETPAPIWVEKATVSCRTGVDHAGSAECLDPGMSLAERMARIRRRKNSEQESRDRLAKERRLEKAKQTAEREAQMQAVRMEMEIARSEAMREAARRDPSLISNGEAVRWWLGWQPLEGSSNG